MNRRSFNAFLASLPILSLFAGKTVATVSEDENPNNLPVVRVVGGKIINQEELFAGTCWIGMFWNRDINGNLIPGIVSEILSSKESLTFLHDTSLNREISSMSRKSIGWLPISTKVCHFVNGCQLYGEVELHQFKFATARRDYGIIFPTKDSSWVNRCDIQDVGDIFSTRNG